MNEQNQFVLLREVTLRPSAMQGIPESNMDPDEDIALIVDRAGRIVSCCERAERVFGTNRAQLTGRKMSEFVIGLFLGGSSPSYGERYLAYLCAGRDWRTFDARDAEGQRISVDLNLSRAVKDGQESFLIKLRTPSGSTGNS